jgi:hypothetical protein
MTLIYSSAAMHYAKTGTQFPKVKNLINILLKENLLERLFHNFMEK